MNYGGYAETSNDNINFSQLASAIGNAQLIKPGRTMKLEPVRLLHLCVVNTTMKLLLMGALLIVAGGSIVVVFAEDEEGDYYFREAVRFLNECGSRSLSLCFKERAFTYIDQLPNTVDVEGMFMVKQNDRVRTGRRLGMDDLPKEPRIREEMLERLLAERIYNYLESHTIELKIPKESIGAFKRSFEEEARKKGKKKGNMSMLLLFQLKAALLGALFLKGLAMVAFKALLLAKVALTIATVVGVKKLFEQNHHPSTYEVVAHPHYSAEHHAHFDRSFNPDLAYRGHENGQSVGELV